MLSRLEEKIIQKSYDLLDIHTCKFKHFSYLVRRNKILGVYLNNPFKSHTLSKSFNFKWETLHSEIAMIAATSFLHRSEFPYLKVYNTRINNEGKISMSAPCINCTVALRTFGFRDVYYTGSDGRFHHWDD